MLQKITLQSADGHLVVDTAGKFYIDFTAGIFATNLGQNCSFVREEIRLQADKFHHAYDYPTPIRYQYEKAICKYTGFEAVALFCAGTEATEAAVRVMRKHGPGRHVYKIRTGFHGRTAGVQNGPLVPIKFPESKFPKLPDAAGIILEPYRALDVKFLPDSAVKHLFEKREKTGIMICFDEIQSGFWRTGKLFGYQHYDYDIEPDLVTIGKGMGNGNCISGLLARSRKYFKDVPLSSTNGGNPLMCAAALGALKGYDFHHYRLIKNAKYFENAVKTLPGKVRARGMVAAVILDSVEKADRVCELCQDRGLLVVNTQKNTVKLGPPITIPREAIDDGIKILTKVLREIE